MVELPVRVVQRLLPECALCCRVLTALLPGRVHVLLEGAALVHERGLADNADTLIMVTEPLPNAQDKNLG